MNAFGADALVPANCAKSKVAPYAVPMLVLDPQSTTP
jgi:hypothetical protein